MTESTTAFLLGLLGGAVAGGVLIWFATTNRETWIVNRDAEGAITGFTKVQGRERANGS